MTDNAAVVNQPAAGAPAATPGDGASKAGSTPWYGGFDPELKGYVETKGFPADGKGIEALANSYRNLEKHFGVPAEQLLKLPKDEADVEGWNKIYDRLGRPAKPDEYDIPVPEGVDSKYAKFIADKMHKLGVSKKVAKELAAAQNEFITAEQAEAEKNYEATIKEQDKALRGKWGQAYDKNVQVARGAFAELGITAEHVTALEKVLGFSGVMEFFHGIGSKIGEDKFITGGNTEGFGGAMTPAAAQARIDAIKADPVMSQKYVNGDLAVRAEMDRLHRMLIPAA